MASLVTRCPACSTLFKVVPDQLRISEGWVRCGQCDEVFDAQAQMQPRIVVLPDAVPGHAVAVDSPAPVAAPLPLMAAEVSAPDLPAPDTVTDGAPGVAAQHTEASLGVDDITPDGAESALADAQPSSQREDMPFTEPTVQSPLVVGEEDAHDFQASFLQRMPPARSGKLRWLTRLVVVLLGLTLAGQVVIQQRDRIAATEPALTTVLNALCLTVGCQVAPLRQIEAIVIESSSFIKVRADVYRLSFSIKNTALVPLALPSAELALTDLRDQSVLRRVLAPAEYGVRTATLGPGEELSVVVPVAMKAAGASSDKVTGYRLLVFYP